MKALVQDVYGSSEVMQLREIERPEIGDDEVLLRVHAASLHVGDWHMMTGLPKLMRLGTGFGAPKSKVRGMDVAGRVEAVGTAVTGVQVGDEVFGTCSGSLAEYAKAKSHQLVQKPENVTFAQAAALPTSATTALQALRDHGRVQPGQKVLVIGAAGGVGLFAVQLAKLFGAHVTAVASTSKLELVRSLGADEVIDYTREDFSQRPEKYDLILDTAGNRKLPVLRRAMTQDGTLVIVGGEGGGEWLGGIERQLGALMLSPFTRQTFRTLVAIPGTKDLETLREFVRTGALRPVIDREFPLEQGREALGYLESGKARGKIIVTPNATA